MNEFSRFLLAHGDLLLFAIVLVEQAGLPLPAAPWLLAAGALAFTGGVNPVFAVGTTVLACVVADSVWFYVGRRGGQRVLRLFCRLSLARNSCVGRCEGLFARHGASGLVAAKFLPGLGTVMPPLAGALGMGTGRFLLFDSLGSVVYGSFYIAIGFIFHNQLHGALAMLNRLGVSVLVVGMLFILGYLLFKYTRRHGSGTKRLAQPGTEFQPLLAADTSPAPGAMPGSAYGIVQGVSTVAQVEARPVQLQPAACGL